MEPAMSPAVGAHHTAPEVNRRQVLAFRLSGHHLSERLPPEDWLTAVAAIGLRTSVPGGAETSLHARVTSVGPEALDDAVADRVLVGVESVRGSYLVPVDDLEVFTLGGVPRGDQALRRVLTRLSGAFAAGWSPTRALEVAYAAAVEVLDGRHLTTSEFSSELTKRLPAELSPNCRACRTAHVEPTLFRLVAMSGVACAVPSADHRTRVGRLDQWLGRPLPRGDPGPARDALLRRYLRVHGPATPRALAAWLISSVQDATDRLAQLEGSLAPVRYRDEVAWVRAEDLSAVREAELPTGARLLPPYDPLLTTGDRETLVPAGPAHSLLWRMAGNAGAVLVDGEVVAAWRGRKSGRTLAVDLTPFDAWRSRMAKRVAAEAEAVAALRGCAGAAVTVAA